MSNQKHTPEPWEVHNASSHIIVHSEYLCHIADCGPSFILETEEIEANTARIIECVNACAGIENPRRVIREVREALEKVDAVMSDAWVSLDRHPGASQTEIQHWRETYEMWQNIQAAIAKLKGEQP
jgi:hypothetical protein